MGIVIEQKEYKVIPMGKYQARIESVEEVENLFFDPKKNGADEKMKLRVKFAITDPDPEIDGATISAFVSKKFNKRSTLYAITQAAFGAEIIPSYQFDSDDIVGRKLRIVVIEKKNIETGDVRSRVDGFEPIKAKAPAPAANA